MASFCWYHAKYCISLPLHSFCIECSREVYKTTAGWTDLRELDCCWAYLFGSNLSFRFYYQVSSNQRNARWRHRRTDCLRSGCDQWRNERNAVFYLSWRKGKGFLSYANSNPFNKGNSRVSVEFFWRRFWSLFGIPYSFVVFYISKGWGQCLYYTYGFQSNRNDSEESSERNHLALFWKENSRKEATYLFPTLWRDSYFGDNNCCNGIIVLMCFHRFFCVL